MVVVMFVLLFVFLAMGMPVAISVGLPSLLYVIVEQTIPNFVSVQRMIAGINTYSLLAIPFFIFAANLMNSGGITNRIFKSCEVGMGRVRGGLAYVNIIASINIRRHVGCGNRRRRWTGLDRDQGYERS